ncbi:MAG: type II toxin-antitoxin system VapC family toxin [Bryobacteraceae bacterium]
MTTFVVDASVVVKCVNEEDQTAQAEALMLLSADSRIGLAAPDLLELEVTSVVVRAVRRGNLGLQEARAATMLLRGLGIEQLPHRAFLDQAFELALAHQQAVYDCLYLALALQIQCPLITADRRFHEGVRRSFPMVLMLGAPIPGL